MSIAIQSPCSFAFSTSRSKSARLPSCPYASRTSRGRVNLNTNGSRPGVVARLVEAGLDSIRVSLNSAVERTYNAYYRPIGYRLGDVVESIGVYIPSTGVWFLRNSNTFGAADIVLTYGAANATPLVGDWNGL